MKKLLMVGCALLCSIATSAGAQPAECDDGNLNNGDGCSALCTREVCGNGTLDFGEKCDDGNVAGELRHGARADRPGVRRRQVTEGEACDDGNALACGRCNATCTAVVGAAASGFLVITADAAALLAAQGAQPATFTLDDGVHPPVTFQLVESAEAVQEGNIAVVVGATDSATALGIKILDAITP